MGHKPKANPKTDMNAKTSHDYAMLELAKARDGKKRLKTVRVDRCTLILVEVGVSEAEAVKRFRMNVNQ